MGKIEKIGGRKFITMILAMIMVMKIFIVMFLKDFLTPGLCMQFVYVIAGIAGSYKFSNALQRKKQ